MKLTNAVSGLARSGATRSGYPVLQGVRVPLYALSGVARSGATRSNYVGSKVFINIGGGDYGSGAVGDGVGILAETLAKSDAINNTPVTLTFTARGWVPVEGTEVMITLGSRNNLRREFGGTILNTRHRYVGDKPVAENMLYDVSCIDYTWALDRRKVSGNYTNASVAAIAASLLTFAPAGYTLRVDPDIGAEILDQITFTEQVLSSAFTQLVKRVGGDFFCDFAKVVHLFFENTALSPPRIVNAVHPSLGSIAFTRDLSQVATRVLGSFGGSNALAQITPGDIFLPVETTAWYLPQGGTVLVGQQRVTYSGLDGGGRGSLVGPGAAPTSMPNAALQPGAGVDVGSHDYAVTFQTAQGESIPGPRLTLPVGIFLPPTTAPTTGIPEPGATGPDPGAHDYAVSFVISTGETVPGPRVSATTDLTPPPTTGPTPDSVSGGAPTATPTATAVAGAGLSNGAYQYAYTFATAAGETVPSPISAAMTAGIVNVGVIPNPTSAPTWTYGETNGYLTPQTDYYISVSFLNAKGQTAAGPAVYYRSNGDPSGFPQANDINLANIPVGPAGTTGKRIFLYTPPTPQTNQRHMLWKQDVANNTTAIQNFAKAGVIFVDYIQAPSTNTTGTPTAYNQAALTNIATGPSGTTGRKLYRTAANGSQLKFLTTLANNSSTTATDAAPDASLGANAPTSATFGPDAGVHDYAVSFITATGETLVGPIGGSIATTGGQTIHVSDIPSGTGASNAAVTARNLYRRSGGAALRFVATIAGNGTTTYVDALSNASLGAAPPATNTASLRQIPLSAIPLGNSLVTARKVYRTRANTGGGTLLLVTTLADNTTTTFLDTVNDAALGAAALTVGTAQAAQVALTAIPLGAAAVTARKLYRTKAGATPLLLLVTLGDNTTTTFLDVYPDNQLPATTAPTSDTSGLQQPAGNVFAGSPTLLCASVAGFRPTGGWAVVGSQGIRYSSLSGNQLLGIPTSGNGAITATISYNTTVVAAPMLTGIPPTGLGVIKYPVLKGDAVNLWIQVDNLDAQAAVRVQLPGSDGIIEDEIQDGRLSYTEGVARCQARLDLLAALDSEGKVGIVSVSYVCRDINAVAGATVTVNLGPPINLRGEFLIQRVGVSQFHVPNLHPTYTVEASSIRFSAEEMLRLLRQGAM